MNRLASTVICFLTCLFASLAFAQTPTPHPDLATADWSVKQAKVLNAESNDAVFEFMLNLFGLADLGSNIGKVCEFHFADLRHSGLLSLVVSYDSGGTSDCNEVEIFDKNPGGIEDYDFNSSPPNYFDSIEDIKGDGHHELIVDIDFAAGSRNRHCTASWPVVYAWDGTGYSDLSGQYKGYYQRTLGSLQKEIAAAESQKARAQQESAAQRTEPAASVGRGISVSPQFTDETTPRTFNFAQAAPLSPPPPLSPPDSEELDCNKAEAAKIERFLGISRDAGMSEAIKWANSDYPYEREFAVSNIADIKTAQAIGYLRTLSNDPDRDVASGAKELLKYVTTNSGPITYPTIRGSAVLGNTGYPPAK
jgi:hypothetical protein